jgi:hypothetical protein
MDTGISQRHLSFVESGQSATGRDFLSVASDALNIPLRELNDLLLASGFAPQYNEQSIDAEQMMAEWEAWENVSNAAMGKPKKTMAAWIEQLIHGTSD